MSELGPFEIAMERLRLMADAIAQHPSVLANVSTLPKDVEAIERELDILHAKIDRLNDTVFAVRAQVNECVTEIAQSVLESGYPLEMLPVDHARLALININKRLGYAQSKLKESWQ